MTLIELAYAPKLLTPGGAALVTGAAEVEISVVDPGSQVRGVLFRIDAVCVVAATTAGVWTLRGALAGSELLELYLGAASAAIGTRLSWEFPIPWRAESAIDVFTIQQSVATLGSWRFTCNGTMQ